MESEVEEHDSEGSEESSDGEKCEICGDFDPRNGMLLCGDGEETGTYVCASAKYMCSGYYVWTCVISLCVCLYVCICRLQPWIPHGLLDPQDYKGSGRGLALCQLRSKRQQPAI